LIVVPEEIRLSRWDRLIVRWWLLRGGLYHWVERRQMWVAWHVPKWLMRWVVIRAFAKATTGDYGDTEPDKVTFRMLFERNGL
jgi:hypothetical protein